MIRVSQVYIYPIKSLRGLAVDQAVVEEKGFRYDRRFMLVTPSGEGMTQHRFPQMTQLEVTILDERCLRVWHRHHPDDVLKLPLTPDPAQGGSVIPVRIWDSNDVAAQLVSPRADRWFSRILNEPCRLVFMPPSTHRAVDPAFARYREAVSFADVYPYLLIGQASLDDLNQRVGQPLEMIRFRPNMVVSGSQPYEEDTWERFQIGALTFYRGDVCGRCLLTTLDPVTGQKGAEPLRTLATYRQQDNKLVFGQYVLVEPDATDNSTKSNAESLMQDTQVIRVGQPVRIMSRVCQPQSIH